MRKYVLAGCATLMPLVAVAGDHDPVKDIDYYAIDERVCQMTFPDPGMLEPKLKLAMAQSGLGRDEVLKRAKEAAVLFQRKLAKDGTNIEQFCEERDYVREGEWYAYDDAQQAARAQTEAQATEAPSPTKRAENSPAPDAMTQRKPNPVKLVLRSRVNAVVCNFKDSSDFMFNAALIKAAEALQMSPRAAYDHLTREAYKLASETIDSEQARAYFCMMTRAQATSELLNGFSGGKAPRMEINSQRDFPDWGKQ